MDKPILCLYGANGVAREIAELAREIPYHDIIFVDDINYNREVNGYPVYNFDYILKNVSHLNCRFSICVGEPYLREILHNKVAMKGYSFENISYKGFKQTDTTTIGTDCLITSNTIITCNVSIGNGCYLNTNCIVNHDVKIGNFSVIAPGVKIGGFTEIGNRTYVGIGATISDRIKVGNNCIIGAGAVVVHDVKDNEVVAGNPAKFLRINKSGKVFKA